MSRLPTPGSDEGSWGEILNDFLSQVHNSDGTLADNVVTAAQIAPSAVASISLADASISESKLDTLVQAKLNSGGSPVVDATTSTKGVIQLAGDLGGTATAPTVPGLSGKAALSHTHAISDTSGLQTALDTKANQVTTYSKTEVDTALANKANTADTYTKADIDTSLAGKADTSHTHSIANITNLQTSLDTKADQTALTTGLASKANQSTTYTKAEVDTALSAKPDATNTYTKTEVDTALSGKATTSHTHTISDTTGLQTALDGKAAQATTYTKAEIDATVATLPSTTHTHKQILPYSQAGTLQTTTGTFRLYNDSDAAWTIMGVRASVGTAPSGQAVVIDVNVGATTIFTTQGNRPSIAAGTTTSGLVASMNITTVAEGEYLTIDIDQIGNPLAGTDLCVQVIVK